MHASLPIILELAAIGAFTGFVAGLLGVGGGGIMVPFISALLIAHGLDTGLAVKIAIATSMATIIFTSISSVRQHWHHGHVRWDIFLVLAPGIVVGGLIASMGIFAVLKGNVIALLFAIFMLVVATRMLSNKKVKPERQLPGTAGLFTAGGVIGLVSGLVGIGGGSLSVPFMNRSNVEIHQAVGTSAALGFPIAVSSVIGYIIASIGMPELPSYSLGFIWLPGLASIALLSVLTAPLGAMTAHRLPIVKLKRIFALMLYVLGMYMFYQALTG